MTITLEKWLENMTEKYLTISDIEGLQSGDSLNLLCLDRNFFDLIEHNLNKPSCRPDFFFQF